MLHALLPVWVRLPRCLRTRPATPPAEDTHTRHYAPRNLALWIIVFLGLWITGSAAIAQPVPASTLTMAAGGADGTPLIGERLTFEVAFDNAAADVNAVGYGPFIDLVLPNNGVDGDAGNDTSDGVSWLSGSYLDAPLSPVVLLFPDPGDGSGIGCLDHPFAVASNGTALEVCGATGDQLVVLTLPFGSFVPDQPVAAIEVEANLSNLADLNTLLAVRSRAGFRFGADPLDNPGADPPLIEHSAANGTGWTTGNLRPTLVSMELRYIGPEDETATGPNFPRQYRAEIDIANGQEITDFDVTAALPPELAYLTLDATSPAGVATETPPVGTPASDPNNRLTVNFPSAIGTTDDVDASFTFSFFVARLNASASEVLDPLTGDDHPSPINLNALGDWDPLDPRDPDGTDNVQLDPAGFEHTLSDQSIAIQKHVTLETDPQDNGPSPGDVVSYRLEIQVSDFFVFDHLVVLDTLGDGLRYDESFTPTLSVTEHGQTSTGTIDESQVELIPNFSPISPLPNDGTTLIRFLLSDVLAARFLDTILHGGCVLQGGTGGGAPDCNLFNAGPTTATLIFRAVIQEEFSDDFPSMDASVDEGDVLDNDVLVDGDLLDRTDLGILGTSEDDDSQAQVQVRFGELLKTIYAINGSTELPDPLELRPGDALTYRIRYSLTTSDIEDLVLRDFLPLPIFDADEMTSLITTSDPVPPPAGIVRLGPDDTFHARFGAQPAFAVNSVANDFSVTWGDFDDPGDEPSEIDLLFTITASDLPFADGLFLTNQARIEAGSTNADGTIIDSIVQIRLRQPVLNLTKGAVTSDRSDATFDPSAIGPVSFTAPGDTTVPTFAGMVTSSGLSATPVDSNVSGLDAGDQVRFALVIENEGGSGAFDLIIRDTLPAGLIVPPSGLALQVARGDGSQLSFQPLGPQSDASDLFATGIEIVDPIDGAASAFDADSGTNIIIITYDLAVDAVVAGSADLVNAANLVQYGGVDGSGPTANHVLDPDDFTDSASVSVLSPVLDKTIVSTSADHTSDLLDPRPVVIGERAVYQVALLVPEGTLPASVLLDFLDPGLTFESLDDISASPGLLTSHAGGFAGVLADATVQGLVAIFPFDNLTNTDRDNATAEMIVLTYTVRVADLGGVSNGANLDNLATWQWSSGSLSASAAPFLLLEPSLRVRKSTSPENADAGDTVTYTVLVQHRGISTIDAFDVVATDLLTHTDLDLVAGTVVADNGTIEEGNDPEDTTVRVSWSQIPLGSSQTVTFDARVSTTVLAGSSLDNEAEVIWTSLPVGIGGVRAYGPASNTATLAIDAPALLKSIVATSEASTAQDAYDGSIDDLTIGEQVTFQIVATIPEGVTQQVIVRDNLPASAVGVLEVLSASVVSVGAGLSPVIANPVPTISDVNLGDGLDDTVLFDFGQVTNPPDGVVDARDRITVEVVARATDIDNNAGSDLLTNTALIDFDGALQPSATASVELVEPTLTLVKSGSRTVGDAGDTIEFTIDIAHDGVSADAFDLVLIDTIPSGLTPTGSVVTSDGPVDPTTSSIVGQAVEARFEALPRGSTARLRFTVRVDESVTPGQLIVNQAGLVWTSLPADDADEERTRQTTDDHRFTVSEPGVVKSVVASSEPSTASGQIGPEVDLTIGEQVTYEIEVTLPEGTVMGAEVRDQLPTSSAVLALESATLITVGDNLSGSFGAGDPGSASDTDADTVDDLALWNLGTVQNLSDNVVDDKDRLVFRVVARVIDVAANQGGLDDDVENTASFVRLGGATTFGVAAVDLVEPTLTLTKTPSTPFADAGDRVRFTLEIAHTGASSADAFKLEIEDTLGAGLAWDDSSTVSTSCTDAVTDDSSAPTIRFSFPLLSLADGSCTIEYDTLIASNVQAGQSLPNQADLTWDSQPLFVADETRRQTVMAGAEVTVLAPMLVKVARITSLDATDQAFHRPLDFDLAIGELVDYRITLIFPEGEMPGAVLVDNLPAGEDGIIEAIGASIMSVGGNLTTTLPGTPVLSDQSLGDGRDDTVTLDFGTVTNQPDGADTEADRIVLCVTGKVVDESANRDGDALVNTASLTSTANGVSLSDQASVDVVEPALRLNKRMGPIVENVVTVAIDMINDGTAPAYDIAIEDVLSDSTWDTATATLTDVPEGFAASLDAVGGSMIVRLATDAQAPVPGFVVPGQTTTFEFTVLVRGGSTPPAIVSNTTSSTAISSLPGADSDERTLPNVNHTAQLGLPQLNASKTIALLSDSDASGTFSPGDVARYTIAITNSGAGDATQVDVTDTPDPLTALVTGSVAAAAGDVLVGNEAGDSSVAVRFATVSTQSTASVTFDVVILGGVDSGVEHFANQALIDSAELPELVTDDPATVEDDDSTITVLDARPDLAVSITDGGASVELEGIVIYTATATGLENQAATGVELRITVPTHAVFSAAESEPGWSCPDGAPSGTICTQSVGALAIGGSAQRTLAIRVNESVPGGVGSLSIDALVADDGNNGPDLNLANNTAQETTPIDAEPELFLRKEDGDLSALPGDVLVYGLTYGNIGNQGAEGVTLTETVPEHTSFDALSSDPSWQCAGSGAPGDSCNLSVGSLAADQFGFVVFGVRVDVELPPEITELSNTLRAEDDGSASNGVPVEVEVTENTPIGTFDRTTQKIYAFEDLKNDAELANDFDYNDWIIKVELREQANLAAEWTRVDLTIEAMARGAGFVHQPRLDLGIEGPVTIVISRFDRDGSFTSREITQSDGDRIADLALFGDTWKALPPAGAAIHPFASNTAAAQTGAERIPGLKVHIRVEIDEPTRNPRVLDDLQTSHLDETFNHLVGPFIHVIDTGETIHHRWRLRSATQDVVTAELYGLGTPLLGFPLDLVEIFPDSWRWPVERVPVWDGYPSFVNHLFSGRTQFQDWFEAPVLSDIWPVVGATPGIQDPMIFTPTGLPPGSLAFDHTFGSPVSASPVVADLDGDGLLEVIAGGFLDEIVIFDHLGKLVRTIDPGAGTQESNGSAAAADLDDDGDLEILRGYDDGRVYAFHHDGSLFGTWDTGGATLRSTVVVADLDGGREPEIFVLAGNTQLYGWRTDGSNLPGFPRALGGTADAGNAFVLLPSPAVADIDGTGGFEIIASSNGGQLHVLRADGSAVDGWPVDLDETVLSSPAIADLDPQPGLEIVIADDGGAVTMLGADGTIIRTMSRVLGGPSSPAVGDLDGDQQGEIVVGSLDGKIYAWHHDGTAVAGWPVVTGSAIQGSPSLADLDGDGDAEVLVGSFDTGVYALDGDASAVATSAGGTFPVNLGAIVFSSPAVADLDGDGLPSIIVGSHDRFLYALEADGDVIPGSILWSEFRGGGGHTGSQMPPLPPDNGVAPQVVGVRAGSDTINACGESRESVQRVDVIFSEILTDLIGDDQPGDVTNPESYRLIRAGANRDLDTNQCGPAQGDDVALGIDAVTWNPIDQTASLMAGDGQALPDDLYRVLVCDTLTDLQGGALDGDDDGSAGGDWLGQMRVARNNAFANGQFDCGLEAWALVPGGPAFSHAQEDVDQATASGSIQIVDLGSPRRTTLAQCAALPAERISFQGAIQMMGTGSAEVVRQCTAFDGPACSGAATVLIDLAARLGDTSGQWLPFRDIAQAPVGSVSIACQLGLTEGAGPTIEVRFDAVSLSEPILFADGFESGTTSAWSETTGDLPVAPPVNNPN